MMAFTQQHTDLLGQILSDGTPVTDLVDLDRREVSLRLFSDPEVYKLEQRYLFARSWILLGHETEIQNAGDYVTRYIAGDSVIVSRTRDGAIAVMLNVCPH